jgi:beta-glucosidase
MRKLINKLVIAGMILSGIISYSAHAQEASPKAPQLGKAPVKEVIAAMSLEEKASFVVGPGIKSSSMIGAKMNPFQPAEGTLAYTVDPPASKGAGWTLAIPRLGIPSIVMADGPAGVSLALRRPEDLENKYFSTAFPVATAVASTWDEELVYKLGQSYGNEVAEYGVDILLAPAVNIQRNPLNGRNFEYFSEDPLLSGKMGAAMIRGVQSKGVGVSLKHFVANNQETNRTNVDAVISERALREIYLKGFEIAVKESEPWTIMAAYNLVNGKPCTANRDLLHDVLREDWGFNGLVMTDWGVKADAGAQMNAGLDLIMPGPHQSEDIIKAVEEGRLSNAVLDKRVEHILNLIMRTPKFQNYSYSNKPDLKANIDVARKVAADGMVLLKNENQVLPIVDFDKSIALFGNGSYVTNAGGAGSGFVMNAPEPKVFASGLEEAGFKCYKPLADVYNGYINKNTPRSRFIDRIRGRIARAPELQIDSRLAKETAQNADVALVTIRRNSEEGKDREIEYDFKLSETELQNLTNISEAFHKKGKKVIVVLNIGSAIETASWRDLADAILVAWQPGQVAGDALADVVMGKINPSGKLPITFPKSYSDVPSATSFPGLELAGQPTSVYNEGVYVGYRYYGSFNIEEAFPFGYGLSYTNFKYDDLKTSSQKFTETIDISLTVKNAGEAAGKEVVQLYLSAPDGKLEKPAYELKKYAKTALLQPGEVETIKFTLNKMDLASFDADRSMWIAEPGTYQIHIGASSKDFRLDKSFEVKKEIQVEKVNKALSPEVVLNELSRITPGNAE